MRCQFVITECQGAAAGEAGQDMVAGAGLGYKVNSSHTL